MNRRITQQINKLAHVAFTSQDYSTFNFLQWYVAEQHEEEKLFKGILDKLELVGEDGKALFFIDKDLAALAKKAHLLSWMPLLSKISKKTN